eukprot:1154199-Pelagomonas_calceolata.AAC.6
MPSSIHDILDPDPCHATIHGLWSDFPFSSGRARPPSCYFPWLHNIGRQTCNLHSCALSIPPDPLVTQLSAVGAHEG